MKEEKALSFVKLALDMVMECVIFLKEHQVMVGQALLSTNLEAWFNHISQKLEVSNKEIFLFDPTVLVFGIMKNLGSTLKRDNKLDITNTEEVILIPTKFIQDWGDNLRHALCGGEKDKIMRELLGFE